MATAAKQLETSERVDARGRRVGKRVQNKRPAWSPAPQRLEVSPGSGIFRDETEEQAWQRARQLVRHYTAIGYPQEVICRLMEPPLCEDTLHKYFKYEIENGKLIQDAKVAGTIYFMATSGRHGDMSRFWARARMGWRDRDETPPLVAIQFQQIPGDDQW